MINSQEGEEIIGKSGSMRQPQWEHSFDLEIDEKKQVVIFLAFYNKERRKQKL